MDYLVKAIIFVPFMLIVYQFIDFFMLKLTSSINGLPYVPYICQFGVFEGLSVYFSILVGAFGAKQVINFLR